MSVTCYSILHKVKFLTYNGDQKLNKFFSVPLQVSGVDNYLIDSNFERNYKITNFIEEEAAIKSEYQGNHLSCGAKKKFITIVKL